MDVFPGRSCIMLGDRVLVFQKEDSRGQGFLGEDVGGTSPTFVVVVFFLLILLL